LLALADPLGDPAAKQAPQHLAGIGTERRAGQVYLKQVPRLRVPSHLHQQLRQDHPIEVAARAVVSGKGAETADCVGGVGARQDEIGGCRGRHVPPARPLRPVAAVARERVSTGSCRAQREAVTPQRPPGQRHGHVADLTADELAPERHRGTLRGNGPQKGGLGVKGRQGGHGPMSLSKVPSSHQRSSDRSRAGLSGADERKLTPSRCDVPREDEAHFRTVGQSVQGVEGDEERRGGEAGELGRIDTGGGRAERATNQA
jgi:hypothetical protein